MKLREPVTLARDCDAFAIPAGSRVKLPGGSQVTVLQTLGGNYTVFSNHAGMVRIDAKDADAIGEAVAAAAGSGAMPTGPADETAIWDALNTCYDPEIPVNIVDLGLIYDCKVEPRQEGGSKVAIKMTLTAPGCGMGEVLKGDVERKVGALPNVRQVDVDLVGDPIWNRSMRSDAAKLELGML